MNKDIPKRKSIRLKDYDYSENGAYFVTICTKDKKHILAPTGCHRTIKVVYDKVVSRKAE